MCGVMFLALGDAFWALGGLWVVLRGFLGRPVWSLRVVGRAWGGPGGILGVPGGSWGVPWGGSWVSLGSPWGGRGPLGLWGPLIRSKGAQGGPKEGSEDAGMGTNVPGGDKQERRTRTLNHAMGRSPEASSITD